MTVIPHLSATQAFKKILVQDRYQYKKERDKWDFFCPNAYIGLRLFKEMEQPSEVQSHGRVQSHKNYLTAGSTGTCSRKHGLLSY